MPIRRKVGEALHLYHHQRHHITYGKLQKECDRLISAVDVLLEDVKKLKKDKDK